MKRIFIISLMALALAGSSPFVRAQVITTGGSVLGRPLAITGRTGVRFEQLPANVQQAIRQQARQGVVSTVHAGVYSGLGYRVTFSENGAVRTLQFSANGAVLSGDGGLITQPMTDARTISYPQLPPEIQNTLATQVPGAAITSVTRGIFRAPVYDALVQLPGPSYQHIVVTQSGGVLQPIAINEAAGAAAPAPPIPNVDAAAVAASPVGQPVSGNLAFKDIGWSIQKPMLDRTSYAHIDSVQQLQLPDGRLGYRGLYMKDSQQYQITVAQDGTVISEGLLNAGVTQ
jgi:hypothetical protein